MNDNFQRQPVNLEFVSDDEEILKHGYDNPIHNTLLQIHFILEVLTNFLQGGFILNRKWCRYVLYRKWPLYTCVIYFKINSWCRYFFFFKENTLNKALLKSLLMFENFVKYWYLNIYFFLHFERLQQGELVSWKKSILT